jgi:hypothetical protein
MLWDAARAQGRNPGPQPSDLRGTLKLLALLIGVLSMGSVAMMAGLYVGHKVLGWGPWPTLALSFVLVGAAVWLVGRCAEFMRRRSRR